MSPTTRDEQIDALLREIKGSLDSSALFDRSARIYRSVDELAYIAGDPVVAHEVPTRRPLDVALTHGRQALGELNEMLDWIAKSLGDASDEYETVKRALGDVEQITACWADEKARWT